MMSGKVPPFIDEDAERIIRQTRQSIGSTIVMAFGWTLLTVALTGGAYLAYRYLTDAPENRFPIPAPLIVLGFTYLAGWVVSLVSIRAMHNLVMPVVVRVYTFGVLGGILLVYFRAIYKIFNFPEGGQENLLPSNANFLVLFAGFLLLVTLSLLVEKFYLKPHAIILLIAVGVQLILAVYHYVFVGSKTDGLVSFDMYYLLCILFIALLLTRRYRLFRQVIGRMFK
jgi:hypothetical protein